MNADSPPNNAYGTHNVRRICPVISAYIFSTLCWCPTGPNWKIKFLKRINPYDILKNSGFIETAVTRGQPMGGNIDLGLKFLYKGKTIRHNTLDKIT